MAKREKPDFNKLMSRANGGAINPLMSIDDIMGDTNIDNRIDEIHTLSNDNYDDMSIREVGTSSMTNRHTEDTFQPRIDIVNNDIKDDTDKEVENKITTIILTATTSVQVKCEEDEKGSIIQVKYFDKKVNSTLLKKTFDNIFELVGMLNMGSREKHNFFNRVISEFISNRLSFISITCLDSHYSPAYVEKTMREFLQIDKECISPDILDVYFDSYYSSCVNMIHSRIGRTTIYMSELLSEALDIKKRTEGVEMSFLINDLLTKNIDSKYIEKAKENLYNRKPIHEHYPKRMKSELQREKRKLKLI